MVHQTGNDQAVHPDGSAHETGAVPAWVSWVAAVDAVAVPGESVRSDGTGQALLRAEDLGAPQAAARAALQASAEAAVGDSAAAVRASADAELLEPAVSPAKQQRLRVDVLA